MRSIYVQRYKGGRTTGITVKLSPPWTQGPGEMEVTQTEKESGVEKDTFKEAGTFSGRVSQPR